MDFNTTLDSIINNVNTNQTTLRSLLAQLQHTTITSSDDAVYDAPTFDEATGIWTLAQATANVGGLFVGCYKLPNAAINSFISSVTILNNSYTPPSSPTAPASVTLADSTTIDLTGLPALEGQTFNSFCIRSTSSFTIEVKIDVIWQQVVDFGIGMDGFAPLDHPYFHVPVAEYVAGGFRSVQNINNQGYTECRIVRDLAVQGHFTRVTLEYSSSAIIQYLDTLNFALSATSVPAGSHAEYVFTGSITTSHLRTDVFRDDMASNVTIHKITFEGTGVNPFAT